MENCSEKVFKLQVTSKFLKISKKIYISKSQNEESFVYIFNGIASVMRHNLANERLNLHELIIECEKLK